MKEAAYVANYEFEDDHWWFVGRRHVLFRALEPLLARLPGPPRILDYGCGTGATTIHLERFGEVWGGDASEISLDYCRRRGLANIVDTNRELPFEPESFDLVTLLDVLEHLEDDRGLLEKIQPYLKSDGCVAITVPAYEFLWSGEDFVSNHVRRYTAGGLRKVVEAAGFEVVKLTYFNTFLFFPIVAVLLLKRIFLPRSMYETDFQELPGALNSLLEKIFRSEAPLTARLSLPFGASILCIARRTPQVAATSPSPPGAGR